MFLVFSLVFLAVLSEAKDKKKDKDDKKLKAKALELNVTGQNWPEPNDKQKDWLLDADHTKFLDKWQPLSDSEAKKLGPISKNNFSSEGICNKKYKCETITYGSIANIDKDVKNPAKKLKPIKMKQMDTFLEHLKKRKPIKLTHHIQKNSLLAAEIHHSGVVLRLTERNGKDISGEHAAALAFDAFKYMIMSSEPQAVRAMVAQPDNKPLLERSACIFPKGANRAQADNYCRGKDADPDEDDEKEAKSKKKDDDDSCPADGGKKDKQGKSLKDTGSKLLDLLKSMLGIKSDDKEKDGKKCKSDEKGDKKEKKEKKKGDKKKEEKKKDGKKDGKKDDKKDKDDSESSGFELDQVIIKVSTKKSDKGKGEANDDLELDSEGETSKKKAKSAKKEASKSKSEDDESDELDVEHFFDEDGSSSKKKSKSSKKDKATAKKSSSKKAKKVKADEDDENDEDDDFEDASKSKTKKKAGSFKQKSVSKKLAQKKASLKKAAKKQVAKLTKAEDDEADVEADFEESKKSGAKKKSSSKKKNIKKATSKKTDDDAAETKAEKTDSKLWARSAGSEAAYLGAEHMDHLYGRSNEFRYGQFPRQSQLNALRRRQQQQQIIHGTALARRALEFEDSDLIARARMIREPMERREAEPEPESEPEPEPEPKAQPEAQPEAIPKPEEKEGYLFSRAFFDDVNTLLTRQSPEFHEGKDTVSCNSIHN